MRLLGYEFKAAIRQVPAPPGASVPSVSGRGFFGQILESFAGAWQRNVEIDSDRDVLAFSAVYACVSLIANDISKLRIKLVKQATSGIWQEQTDKKIPFLALLQKPNDYQNRIMFLKTWVVSRLMHGAAYVLKERDERGVVRRLYPLNPCGTRPLVGIDGSVYWQLGKNELVGLYDDVVVPGSEVIFDPNLTPWHPLIPISPIYACAYSATQGRRIQRNSAKFFDNMSVPGGVLSAPGEIDDPTADRIKRRWEENFSGRNLGRIAVLGNALKFEPMSIAAEDAQLIEQLRWTVEDVARCFHVPLHMLGVTGSNPSYNNIGALNQAYYSQTLQEPIESIELCLDEGLDLVSAGYGTELDLESLLRMDPSARYEAHGKGIGAGFVKPNEARLKENYEPVEGGDACYMQQQNYSLAALAQRDSQNPLAIGMTGTTQPPPDSDDEDEEEDDEELAAAAVTLVLEGIEKHFGKRVAAEAAV